MQIEGFVEKLNANPGSGDYGPYVAYSIKVMDQGGNVLPLWYQFGFKKPGFDEGAYIRFDATPKSEIAALYTEGTLAINPNPPAKPAKVVPIKPDVAGKAPYVRKSVSSELFGEIGGYFTEDDILRISLSSARASAVELVTALLSVNALPMSGSAAKAGISKRYEEITAMVNKTTVRFFHDVRRGRILDDIDDEGAVEAAPAPLPADAADGNGLDTPEPEIVVEGSDDNGEW